MSTEKPSAIALTSPAVDNYGKSYRVTIEPGDPKFGPVLRVNGTSGSWYLHTLMREGKPRRVLPIDFGQRWDWVNFDAVFPEAVAAITEHAWVTESLSKATYR